MERHGGYRHKATKQTGIPIEEWLDFSANINPFGVPKAVRQAMEQALNQVMHYPDPDCTELRKAIAKHERVKEERIFCGNGGADVIYRYLQKQKPRKVLIPVPTFVEYEEILQNLNTEQICYYKMDKTFTIKENFLEELNAELDLVILCSPNNPTGKQIEETLLYQIVEKAKQFGIKVLMDCSFLDFVEDKREKLYEFLKQSSNVTIVQSFTKMYAIAGIRLGYAILEKEMKREDMAQQGASWSVNHLAQVAGVAALKEKKFVQETVQYVAKERKFLYAELQKLGFFVVESEVNYLLFQVKKEIDLQKVLQERGILIRDCRNYQNLSKGYYRIAVRNHEENERLVQCLKEVIE